MKIIYRYGADMVFSSTDIVADDYQPQAGETFAAIPQPNLMPVKWTGSAWRQATPEEHAAYVKQQQAQRPQRNVEPTAQDKLNAQLTLDNAKQAQVNANQAKLNAQLTLDIAQLKKQLQGTTAQANA